MILLGSANFVRTAATYCAWGCALASLSGCGDSNEPEQADLDVDSGVRVVDPNAARSSRGGDTRLSAAALDAGTPVWNLDTRVFEQGDAGGLDGFPSEPRRYMAEPLTNLPLVQFDVLAAPQATGLRPVSFNLLETGSLGGRNWFAEIENSGSTAVCLLVTSVHFENSQGVRLTTSTPATMAPRYRSEANALSTRCVAAGESAVLLAISMPGVDSVSDLSTVTFEFGGFNMPDAAPHAFTPGVAATAGRDPDYITLDYYRVVGTLTGQGGPISDPQVEVFPKDANGLIFDWLSDVGFVDLQAGESWQFETDWTEVPFSEYELFTDFFDF
jgi:hypothetical protein